MILTLIIIKARALEIGKIHFKTHLNVFVSNMLSTLKIMNFEILSSSKVINFHVI
jgi:hypothetical protein